MLAIEVEAGQMHPDTNVGKYWFLNDQFHQYKKIILVHIFTPAFNSYEWRMKLANFYVEKMQGHIPIEYILQDYRKTQESYSQVLKNLEVLLQTKLAEAFP
jgi:hypothetical protein